MKFWLPFLLAIPALAQEPAPAPAPAAAPTAQPAEEAKTESPAPAAEPWITGSFDVGYRWLTDVRGNFQSYRSVINLGEGPKLFGLDLTIEPPKHRLFDRMDLRGYGWGGDPYNTAHMDVRKTGVYNFTADYRNIAYFNAMPSYANPLAPGGFNEQAFDIHRRVLSFGLDLRPGKHITPYFAFDRNTGYGRGVDTWLVDQSNEYAVPSILRDTANNYRAGVRFEYNRFHITLEEGGTTFKDDDQATSTQPNPGDRTTSYLGQSLLLGNLRQIYGIRGDAIYSRGLITATPFSWLTLTGQFLYSQPKTDVQYQDSANGNLYLLGAFYNGFASMASGTAKQPHVTANGGFEIRPFRKLRIVESLLTDRFHDASFDLLALALTAGTSTSNAVSPLSSLQVVNYNREQVDVVYDFTPKIVLRGGYRHIWGDATVRAGQLSQTGNFASGTLSRDVGLAGATFRPTQKLRINLDYEGGLSDQVYFRTSLNDYHKARAKAQYQVTPTLAVNVNFSLLNSQNPASSVRYDYQYQDESLSLYWTPQGGKRVSVMGEYDRYWSRSDISYISLPFFASATSSYRDNAHIATSQVDLALPGYRGMTPKLSTGGSLFISSGSRPTRFYQPIVRLSLPIAKHVSWNTEWRWYGMGEEFYLYEGFRTHAFTTGFRINR